MTTHAHPAHELATAGDAYERWRATMCEVRRLLELAGVYEATMDAPRCPHCGAASEEAGWWHRVGCANYIPF